MVKPQGKVYFIGAGPGDPELLTLKAKRLIEEADVVIYADSLVPESIANFAKKDAVIICLLYTSPSPRDRSVSRMPSSA